MFLIIGTNKYVNFLLIKQIFKKKRSKSFLKIVEIERIF